MVFIYAASPNFPLLSLKIVTALPLSLLFVWICAHFGRFVRIFRRIYEFYAGFVVGLAEFLASLSWGGEDVLLSYWLKLAFKKSLTKLS